MSNESLRRQLAADPDDEPTAGNVPTREERLESALIDMMNAYERRVRTDCTPEQLALAPWRCAEYVAAETLLRSDSRCEATDALRDLLNALSPDSRDSRFDRARAVLDKR